MITNFIFAKIIYLLEFSIIYLFLVRNAIINKWEIQKILFQKECSTQKLVTSFRKSLKLGY